MATAHASATRKPWAIHRPSKTRAAPKKKRAVSRNHAGGQKPCLTAASPPCAPSRSGIGVGAGTTVMCFARVARRCGLANMVVSFDYSPPGNVIYVYVVATDKAVSSIFHKIYYDVL